MSTLQVRPVRQMYHWAGARRHESSGEEVRVPVDGVSFHDGRTWSDRGTGGCNQGRDRALSETSESELNELTPDSPVVVDVGETKTLFFVTT